MAGYRYTYNGYSTYRTPNSNDWTKSSCPSEHVRGPVIIDAEGRETPIVSFRTNPSASYYTTKTETFDSHYTHSPFSAEYKYGGRWTERPYDDYGVGDNFHKPLNSVHDRPRIGPWNSASWRRSPKSRDYDGNVGGYTEYKDLSNKEFLKSSGSTYRSDYYDDYYRKQGSTMEPHMITSGGWATPTRSTWATPPDTSLFKATTDISEAVGLSKEAVNASYAHSQDSKPADEEGLLEPRAHWQFMNKHDSSLSKATTDISEAVKPSYATAPHSQDSKPGEKRTRWPFMNKKI